MRPVPAYGTGPAANGNSIVTDRIAGPSYRTAGARVAFFWLEIPG